MAPPNSDGNLTAPIDRTPQADEKALQQPGVVVSAAVAGDSPKPIDPAKPKAGGWSSSTNLWRGLTSMSVGVAAVALMVGFKLNSSNAKLGNELEELSARLSATLEIQYVAVLADDTAAASMLAAFDPKSKRLTLKRVGGFVAPADKSLQLWALPYSGGPKSMGVLSADVVTRLTAAASDMNVPELAISLEPKGGVPPGSGPTGPVLFKGAVIETSL
jgi:anti-sigma-K factor RskA